MNDLGSMKNKMELAKPGSNITYKLLALPRLDLMGIHYDLIYLEHFSFEVSNSCLHLIKITDFEAIEISRFCLWTISSTID